MPDATQRCENSKYAEYAKCAQNAAETAYQNDAQIRRFLQDANPLLRLVRECCPATNPDVWSRLPGPWKKPRKDSRPRPSSAAKADRGPSQRLRKTSPFEKRNRALGIKCNKLLLPALASFMQNQQSLPSAHWTNSVAPFFASLAFSVSRPSRADPLTQDHSHTVTSAPPKESASSFAHSSSCSHSQTAPAYAPLPPWAAR